MSPPRPGRGPRLVHVGVDSSTRHLSVPAADVVISAVSVSGPGPVELCDRPAVYPGSGCGDGGPPFIYVVPHGELPPQLPAEVQIVVPDRQISPSFVEAVKGYARLSLESWAMESPVRALASIYAEMGRKPVVLLDGPIFIAQGRGVSEAMRRRYEAVSALESAGVPVVGVVKRIEKSELLSRAPRFAKLAEKWGVRAEGTDSMIVQRLAESPHVREAPDKVYVTPRVVVRGPYGLEKIVEYVVVPAGPWRRPSARSRVYRLEYTEATLRLLGDLGLDPLRAFLADSLAKQSLEPVTVSESDRRSKMITASLKGLLAKSIISLGGRIGYESEVEEEGGE